ncbi:hypothetical protein A4X13_0g7681 [Tilletia indica]|uniref:Uncharacterized protein n=1 Tax=Tilletia indica TaxID=43049 RepID=A0A177TKH9_9BASI|nr:hypothetical protein A4X13_0g7681 [Tilletia indica]
MLSTSATAQTQITDGAERFATPNSSLQNKLIHASISGSQIEISSLMARKRLSRSKYVRAPLKNAARRTGSPGASSRASSSVIEPPRHVPRIADPGPSRNPSDLRLPLTTRRRRHDQDGLGLEEPFFSFGDNGGPDAFDHGYYPDGTDDPPDAFLSLDGTDMTFNTPASAMLIKAQAIPKPLVRFHAWHRLVNSLIPLASRIPDAFQIRYSSACTCILPPQDGYDVRFICQHGVTLHRIHSCKPHLVPTLLLAGVFPASPILPRTALDIGILRMYSKVSDWSNASAFGFSHALQEVLEAMYYDDGLRKLLQSSSLWYSALRHYAIEDEIQGARMWSKIRPPIAQDDLTLTFADLASKCPACFYSLSDEALKNKAMSHPPQHPELIVAIDGNFTQRRLARIDHVNRSAIPPAAFLSTQQVKIVEEEMRRPSAVPVTDDADDDIDNNADETQPPTWHACGSNVLAADERAAKAASGPCDVTGLMGLCCRHDVPLVFCDIDTPGERHHYAIALLKHLVVAVPNLKRIGVLYDIGCRFPAKKNIDRIVHANITWAVSVFHVFGHSYQCQILYSPRRKIGFGWSDGEGMERIWSSLSTLIVAARSMSHGERRHILEQRLLHRSRQARAGLITGLKAKLTSLIINKRDAQAIIKLPMTRAIIMSRYAAMDLRRKGTWTPSAAHAGLDPKMCHALSRMQILRRRKVSQPVPPDSELPEHQRLAMQLLARLGSIRQGHQQVQGRNNRGERGTAVIKSINKSLTKAKSAAYDLLPKLNAAVRSRPRSSLDSFVPLARDELFTDSAYRWVARETQQFSAWWSNPVASAALDAFEELERLHEETTRIRLEVRSCLLWLKSRLDQAFSPDSATSLALRRDLVRIYLAWYPPHAKRRFTPPSVQDQYPWNLPIGAQQIVSDSVKIVPRNLAYEDQDDPDLVEEAVDQIRAGILTVT